MDGLSGFDPSTMTYLATQMAQPGSDPFQDMLLMQDHQSTYGYAGSEDANLHSLQHQSTPPQHKRFSSAYEDPFSDVVSAFEPINQEQEDPQTPSIERDNKLLGFSLPAFDYTLLDWTNRRTSISLTAQLHGMFFLAESPWAAAGDAQPPPSELTCYRRNLFQITGEITMPRALRYIMTDQGEQIPIIGQELMISATESTEGNSVKIISVPWKTPANPGAPIMEETKVEREPPSILLDLMNVQDVDTDFATFPFHWKRLQFRIATANNGRRKELQQHFVVRLKVVATLATGGKIPICEVHSGAIIVRGRSPRNFQSRKDMPLNYTGHTRKANTQAGQPSRSNTGDSTAQKKAASEVPPSSVVAVKHEHNNSLAPPTSLFDAHADFTRPGASSTHQQSQQRQPPHPPRVSLSLVEDDHVSPLPNKKSHIPPLRAPSFSLHNVNSPDESADLLYEYFPLGLDDWMPPVDAVYRPHVVHHTKLPTDPGRRGMRSKRYFSEDVT